MIRGPLLVTVDGLSQANKAKSWISPNITVDRPCVLCTPFSVLKQCWISPTGTFDPMVGLVQLYFIFSTKTDVIEGEIQDKGRNDAVHNTTDIFRGFYQEGF